MQKIKYRMSVGRMLWQRIKKDKSLLFYTLTISSCLTSCKKFLEIDPPKTKLITETVFSNDSTAMAAIRGLYSKLSSSGFATGGNSSITFLSALSADELTTYSNSAGILEFYSNSISSQSTSLPFLWSAPYTSIFQANDIVEGLEQVNGVNQNLKKQLIGEAKFIRSFNHFYLLNLFGDIPLIITTDYRFNTNAPRTPVSKVYDQIISDLNAASDSLSDDYSISMNERIRPNKYAAMALLSRVYLFKNDWTNAEIMASEVIDNHALYDTVALNSIFLKNSREAIWQLLPSVGSNSDDGLNFVLITAPSTSTSSNSTISDGLLAAFESGDKRRENWVGSYTTTTSPTVTYYFPYKYKIKQSAVQTEYSMILRLGEQYLIRAEARINQLGKIADGIADLNIIRKRAGLDPLPASLSKEQALLAVEKERRVELFTEWGHRWLDLKRTGRVNEIMPAVTAAKGGSWKPEWQLYPIPQIQILNDPAMANAQNPGYD